MGPTFKLWKGSWGPTFKLWGSPWVPVLNFEGVSGARSQGSEYRGPGPTLIPCCFTEKKFLQLSIDNQENWIQVDN